MGIRRGSISTPIIADGLIFNMDAANRASYVPDSTSSYNTIDLSISGSFTNDPTYIAPPTSASCWSFDGVDDFIDIYDGSSGAGPYSFAADQGFTISGWFKTPPGTFSTSPNLISFRGTSLIWVQITTNTNGRLQFYIRDDNSQVTSDQFGVTTTNTGTWKHFACVRDVTTDKIYPYLDGNGGYDTTDNSTGAFTTFDKISIGNDNHSGGRYWYSGEIANIQFYNRALSANEVLHNYNALKGRFA